MADAIEEEIHGRLASITVDVTAAESESATPA
jgi:hypothetical protein